MENSGDTDDNGHGTFVAGVVGGALFGVAKDVKLIAVKVKGFCMMSLAYFTLFLIQIQFRHLMHQAAGLSVIFYMAYNMSSRLPRSMEIKVDLL